MVHTKRVYEAADPHDGARFLVERLWPRGMKKAALSLDGWKSQGPQFESASEH